MQDDRPKTKGNLKQPTRQDVINWVSKAWDAIKSDTLIHSFLVCGISNAPDGSEDDLASDDVPFAEWDSEVECSDSDSEADGLGNPFTNDSDSD